MDTVRLDAIEAIRDGHWTLDGYTFDELVEVARHARRFARAASRLASDAYTEASNVAGPDDMRWLANVEGFGG